MTVTTETRLEKASLGLDDFFPFIVARGVVVDDHPTDPRLKAGTTIRTSEVIAIDGSLILTKSGTRYRLV